MQWQSEVSIVQLHVVSASCNIDLQYSVYYSKSLNATIAQSLALFPKKAWILENINHFPYCHSNRVIT